MKIYLGGHLNFYHPQKSNWLEVNFDDLQRLADILEAEGIPLGEVHLVVINGETQDLQTTLISDQDEVRVYSAVGGG